MFLIMESLRNPKESSSQGNTYLALLVGLSVLVSLSAQIQHIERNAVKNKEQECDSQNMQRI